MIIMPNAGMTALLDKMLKAALSVDESYTLKLYKNDYTPTTSTTSSSFTECDFTGYSSATLTRTGWGASSISGGNAVATYGTQQSWTCGATGNTVYGYYVLGASSGTVLWAERFATTRTLANGDQLKLTPTFTLAQL